MSAREKLNSSVIRGIIVISAVVGLLFENWYVFFGLAAAMIACALHARDLRPSKSTSRRP